MAAEFVGTFTHYRPGLPAIALCSDSATITALGNDFGFDRIFARQVEAHGLPGDVLIVFTTSGNSKNILLAVEEAIKRRMAVLALAGKGGDIAEARARHVAGAFDVDSPDSRSSDFDNSHGVRSRGGPSLPGAFCFEVCFCFVCKARSQTAE